MAADSAPLVVSAKLDAKDIERGLAAAVRASEREVAKLKQQLQGLQSDAPRRAARNMDQLRRSAASAGNELRSLSTSLRSMGGIGGAALGGLGGGILAGFGVREVQQLLDANTRIQNALKVTGLEGQALTRVYEKLRAAALANGAPLEALTTLYSKVALNQRELGITTEQLTDFTNNVAQALRLGGTSAEEAQGALLQLSQLLGSGTVRAEEFNSVLEGAPTILQAVAAGNDEAAGSVARLRKIMLDGGLTSQEFFNDFQEGSAKMAGRLQSSQLTISGALTNLQTTLIDAAGKFDAATESSQKFAEFIGVRLPQVINESMPLLIEGAKLVGTAWGELGDVMDAVLRESERIGKATGLSQVGEAFGAKPYSEVQDGVSEVAASLRTLQTASDTFTQQWAEQWRHITREVALYGERVTDVTSQIRNDSVSIPFDALVDRLQAGTATAEDFDRVIAALQATGTETAQYLIEDLEAVRGKLDDVRDRAENATKPALEALARAFADALGQGVNSLLDTIIQKFAQTLPESIQRTIGALQQAAQLSTTVGGQLDAFGNKLGTLTPLGSFGGQFMDSFAASAAGQRVTSGTDPAAAKAFLRSRAVSKAAMGDAIERLDNDFATRVAQLLAKFPGLTVNEAFRTYEYQAQLYRKLHGKAPVARPGTSRHERGAAVDLTLSRLSPEQIEQLEDEARRLGLANPVRGDRGHFQMAGGADEAAESTKRLSTAYDDLMAKQQRELELQQQINAINADASLTEDQKTLAIARARAEVEALEIAEQLLNAARDQGKTITPELTAQINAQAQAMAAAGVTAEELSIKQQQAAETAEEQRRASEQLAQQVGSIAKSAIGGFINDMRNGVDAGEAFSNMLDRIIDGLINMALEAAFSAENMKALFGGLGGLGGGFGGIGSGIGGGLSSWLLGAPAGLYKKGGIVGRTPVPSVPFDPRAFRGAKQYASGGIVPGAIPAWLHPGELVVPRNMVGRASGGNSVITNVNNSNMRMNIDMGRDVAAASPESGKAFAEHMRQIVQVELVRESRPGGLLRRAA